MRPSYFQGYPSYYADCQLHYTNTGTIPVVVEDLRVGPAGGPMVSIPFDECVDLDLDGDGEFDINIEVFNETCMQIEPGETVAISMCVHVKQAAPQGEELKFVVEQQLNQFNEAPRCQGPQ